MNSLRIDADFPGGNILVERIEGNTVYLRQDPRDTPQWWFYWCFRVRGMAGRRIHFVFTSGDVFTSLGPCYSADGRRWRYLGRQRLRDNSFRFRFPGGQRVAFFALAYPYQEPPLREFLTRHRSIRVTELTRSEDGRRIEHLVRPSGRGRFKVLLTARHHACETVGNYVLEGVFALADSGGPEARFLQDEVDLHAIPLVDKDGVVRGDQGKFRHPHDHWIDYRRKPCYAPVRALMAHLPTWRGELALAIDVHCPWLRGGRHDHIFAVEATTRTRNRLRRFLDGLEEVATGPLRLNRKLTVRYGTSWNRETAAAAGWFSERGGADLAFSLEFPYALAGEQKVTPARARQFGRDLGRAIARYVGERYPLAGREPPLRAAPVSRSDRSY